MKRITALLFALVFAASSVAIAQGSSRSATATASIHVDGALTLVTSANIDFGTVFSNAGLLHSSSVPTQATWSGNVSAGANLSISIAVPPSLSDGVGHSLTFACGANTAFITSDGGSTVLFTPATGLSSYPIAASSSGAFLIHLGQDAPGCTVDVGSLQSGGLFKTYSGNIVTTVTVL